MEGGGPFPILIGMTSGALRCRMIALPEAGKGRLRVALHRRRRAPSRSAPGRLEGEEEQSPGSLERMVAVRPTRRSQESVISSVVWNCRPRLFVSTTRMRPACVAFSLKVMSGLSLRAGVISKRHTRGFP